MGDSGKAGSIPSRRLRLALCAVLLLGLNLAIAWRLFQIEFCSYPHSIEGVFISIARVLMKQPADTLWWPLWDAGMPFLHTYFPLGNVIIALTAKLWDGSPAWAFHAISGVTYCLGPVTLMLLARELCGSVGWGFAAGLLLSLTSPSAWLFAPIRADVGEAWGLRRLHALVTYGEMPHLLALALLPLALAALHRALTRRKLALDCLAGVLCSAVVLTNAFGAASLGMTVICLLASGFYKEWKRAVLRVGVIGLTAYLWISPLFPPSLLRTMGVNTPTAGGTFTVSPHFWLAQAFLIAGFLGLAYAGKRLNLAPHRRFALLFLWLTGVIVAVAYVFNVYLAPQPHRYHLEMEMAFCLLVSFLLQRAAGAIPLKARRGVLAAAGALALVAATAQSVHAYGYAVELLQPMDMATRIEYRVAKFMTERFRTRRVMPTGSCTYYFNVFSDTPQFGGGHDNLTLNWVRRVAEYVIYSGENAGALDGDISVLWLKAFGVRAISVHGQGSQEVFKAMRNVRKFEGLLPVLWRDGDDTIYEVPQRHDSLAHVVPREALVKRQPIHGLDVAEVRRYVAAIEDPAFPLASLEWRNFHQARVSARLDTGQVLSLQVNYHPGWRARANGSAAVLSPDALGLMVVDTGCRGNCTVELEFDGGLERKATQAVSILTSLVVLTTFASRVRRRILRVFRISS